MLVRLMGRTYSLSGRVEAQCPTEKNGFSRELALLFEDPRKQTLFRDKCNANTQQVHVEYTRSDEKLLARRAVYLCLVISLCPLLGLLGEALPLDDGVVQLRVSVTHFSLADEQLEALC